MGFLFQDDLHDGLGTWLLGYIPYGGADFGEVAAVAQAVGNGDDSAFYEAFVAAGDGMVREAEDTLARGHRSSARELFLRASAFYGKSYHPIFGKPVDPRLLAAFAKQIAAFDQGLGLSDPPIRPLRIPFEGASMAAYLIPAVGHAHDVRPLLILNNGYDATITDMYFASAVAASRRGYHVLMFDGPGQGDMLFVQGVPIRHDWETVISTVVDFALTLPFVAPDKIALSGWSLGGFLAPRGASGEPRLAALIADPGTWSPAEGARLLLAKMAPGVDKVTPALLQHIQELIEQNRPLRWRVIQRGFWVHGVDSLEAYARAIEPFTMEGRAERIRCPTLLTCAEDDVLAARAPEFFARLQCPKKLLRFTAREGASNHTEAYNRSLINRRVFDWLDDTLGTR